jgi:quercetin dioxygenase-like cupin family protein
MAMFYGCGNTDQSEIQALKKGERERLKALVDADTTIAKPLHLNIDPVQVSPDKFKILLENEHVRVVEYSLKPGEKDDWHTHPPKASYVVSGGKLKVHLENGETLIVDEKTGTASWMDYVARHYVENIGNTTVTIVLTEIKPANQ